MSVVVVEGTEGFKIGDFKVPRASCSRAWRKLTPHRSRNPWPFAVWAGVVVRMIMTEYRMKGAYILVCLTSNTLQEN